MALGFVVFDEWHTVVVALLFTWWKLHTLSKKPFHSCFSAKFLKNELGDKPSKVLE